MAKIKIRCSQLGNVMTSKVGLTEKQEEELKKLKEKIKLTEIQAKKRDELEHKKNSVTLSVGAKTIVRELVNQKIYGYTNEFDTKEVQKGRLVEDDAIVQYNELNFTNYSKNTKRKENDWITGECDINGERLIIDIKSPWSKKTFPKTEEEAHSNLYEWQLRGYMMLWNINKARLSYQLINTPDYLCEYEESSLHVMSNVPDFLKQTNVDYERDFRLENHIKMVVEACQKYADEYEEYLLNKSM